VTARRLGGAAAGLLLALVVASQSLAELPRRLRTLRAFAPRELAVRRLGGSGAAFDRRYFSFLENTRRRLPASTPGVALAGVPGDESHLYLASYALAPVFVSAGPFPGGHPPRGWIVASYGEAPAAAAVFARLPEGALLGPVP
jgi:hypothetical protein